MTNTSYVKYYVKCYLHSIRMKKTNVTFLYTDVSVLCSMCRITPSPSSNKLSWISY